MKSLHASANLIIYLVTFHLKKNIINLLNFIILSVMFYYDSNKICQDLNSKTLDYSPK